MKKNADHSGGGPHIVHTKEPKREPTKHKVNVSELGRRLGGIDNRRAPEPLITRGAKSPDAGKCECFPSGGQGKH